LRVHVRVPATSANLGPGFDALGLALALYNEVTAAEADAVSVTITGEGAGRLPPNDHNVMVRAVRQAYEAAGRPFKGVKLACVNRVPTARGLGSSAAAWVGGLVAGNALLGGPLSRDALLALAARAEGHPDNVAAALHGGFVVCADGRATRIDVPAGLDAVLVVPRRAVRTAKARAALPAEVPMRDAVFNIAHASLLALGLARGDLELVARGLADRIHQPRRAALYPRSMRLLEGAAELGALGATISGAGPSVLVWTRREATAAVLERLAAEAASWADVRRTDFEPAGAAVTGL
jgi:homoserine kinase